MILTKNEKKSLAILLLIFFLRFFLLRTQTKRFNLFYFLTTKQKLSCNSSIPSPPRQLFFFPRARIYTRLRLDGGDQFIINEAQQHQHTSTVPVVIFSFFHFCYKRNKDRFFRCSKESPHEENGQTLRLHRYSSIDSIFVFHLFILHFTFVFFMHGRDFLPLIRRKPTTTSERYTAVFRHRFAIYYFQVLIKPNQTFGNGYTPREFIYGTHEVIIMTNVEQGVITLMWF